jgi:hypothetical protein
MLNELKPYDRDESWIHTTLKYKRMMYGRLGSESGVDPRLCFYTEAELAKKDEYLQYAHPYTIQEMMAKNEEIKEIQRQRVIAREERVAKNLAKLEQWQHDYTTKKYKKEEEGKFNLICAICEILKRSS